MINSIIFSYNRPLQLRLLLEGIAKNSPNVFKINIIYKTIDEDYERGYKLVKEENLIPEINWVKESSFKEDVLKCIDNSQYTCFFTDDDIIFSSFEENQVTDPLLNENVFCFSLRLGENTSNCYTMKSRNILHDQTDHGYYITWDWSVHYLDFGYPLSVDGHIFRTKDIIKMIKKTTFTNPNTFEAGLQLFDNFPRPLMAAFKQSVLVNSPSNIVQNVFTDNRNGEKFAASVEELNSKLLSGEVIDFEQMDFSSITGCHQELEFKFKKK